MADDARRGSHRLHAGLRQANDGAAAGGYAAHHVGNRQEPFRFGKGVRPDRRLHQADPFCAEGSRQQQLALHRGRRHDRTDPPHAARRRVVHGPYNYPLNETFATLIPALLMGNTVVFKPPQYGTLLFTPLLEAFRSAFPEGVINTVYAPGAVVVPRMLASGKVNVLALIGSSKVADHLKKQHPKSHRLRAILGLDAKNAAIILPDADIELTVKECLLGTLSFNGQRCTALKMLIVHRSIAEVFLRRFTEELGKLKVGMPWEPGVSITPLPGLHRTAYMTEAIDGAKAKGARVINEGGGAFCQTLFYPAVVYPVQEGMKLYREEQFGPIIPVMPFDDVEPALQYVITSDHGQQVSIFGSNPQQIGALVDPLVNQVCRVNINCQCQRGPDVFPFAGRKDSAEGTLSVADALRAFSIRSMVAAKQTEASEKLLDTIVTHHNSKFINTRYIF